MKVEELFRISYRDVRQKKRKFRIFEISLMVGVICLLLFGMLSDGVVDYVTKEMNSKSGYKIITLNGYKDRGKTLSFVNHLEGVTGVCEETLILDVGEAIVDDKKVTLTSIRAVAPEMDSFYAVNTQQVAEPIFAGRDLQKGDRNKALIDEYAVLSLGYEDAGSVLGKTVKVTVNDAQISAEIVGVFSLELSENRDDEGMIFRGDDGTIDIGIYPIVITADCVEGATAEDDTYMQVSVGELTKVPEVMKKIENGTDSTVFAEMEMINSLLLELDKVKKILQVISYVLLGISFFTIISVLYVVIEENRNWYEMLNILGYEKNIIKYINAIEVSILSLRVICIASLFGLTVTLLLNNVVYQAIGEANMFIFPLTMLIWLNLMILIVCNAVSLVFTCRVLKNGVEDGKKNKRNITNSHYFCVR